MLNCIITNMELEDQSHVVFYVNLIDPKNHTITNHELCFDPLTLAGDNVMERIKRALRAKLVAELDLSQYVGESFEIDTIYKKAYG